MIIFLQRFVAATPPPPGTDRPATTPLSHPHHAPPLWDDAALAKDGVPITIERNNLCYAVDAMRHCARLMELEATHGPLGPRTPLPPRLPL